MVFGTAHYGVQLVQLDKITILSNEDPLGACPMKEFSAVLKYVPPKKTNIKRQDL
jgi:hypothetical protein